MSNMQIRLFLFFIVKILSVSSNYTKIDESAEVNVDEDDELIKKYKALIDNRPLQLHREYDNRIVGGAKSSIDKHPYIVSIQQVEFQHICGGSIINKWWVLSASHCITENCQVAGVCKGGETDVIKDPRELLIYAGTSDLQPANTGGQIREIYQLVKHPFFSRPLLHNDIALIKVKNAFVFDKKVSPIHLPQVTFLRGKDVTHDYKECKALGWGLRKPQSGKLPEELSEQEKLEIESDLVSDILMEVDLPVIDIRQCQHLINRVYITSRHMCTMYIPGGKDACEGDSGGPLVCKKNNKLLQYGITSWGHGCARPHTPAVFTRTDTYYDWVQRVISGGPNIDYYSSSNKIVYTKWILYVYVIYYNTINYD